MENRINDDLKKLENIEENSDQNYNNLYPLGPRPGISHGFAKIHKSIKDGVLDFCPIISNWYIHLQISKILCAFVTA